FYMSSLISHSRPYFVFDSYAAPRHLHSFPTRRSSDLETYKDSNRDFERSLSVQSPFLNGGLFWTGDSTYEKDQMSANHQFHVERSEEHTSELQSRFDLVCRLLLEKKKKKHTHEDHAVN